MTTTTRGAAASGDAARRFFHDTGEAPTHLLPEPVWRSWKRSAGTGVDSRKGLEFDAVTRGRIEEVRDRNEAFLEASGNVMEGLLRTVARTPWLVLLLGSDGVIAEAFNDSIRLSRELRSIARPGLDLSEARIGTNGPGTALVDGVPVMVVGGEHFLESNALYTCAAAPIRDPFGQLIGCLDLSSHHTGAERRFNPLILVGLYARLIERQLFLGLPNASRVVRLASHGGLFGPGNEALVALDVDGKVLAACPLASALLGMPASALIGLNVGQVFHLPSFQHFVGRAEVPAGGVPLTLCNGLTLLAKAEVTRRAPSPSLAAPSATCMSAAGLVGDPAGASAIERGHLAYRRGIPVLLCGDTGTGKERLARVLHEAGPRREGPWVAINCAAIPENLIESELFGYEDGAFTGARKGGAPGKLEQAHGGTLFLDEIGDMPLALQSRLLRVLEERKVTRIGSHKVTVVDFALISATHRDLASMARKGSFRLDLLYRLQGITLRLPPLRARQDFDAIVADVLAEITEGGPPLQINEQAKTLLARHPWPGNLRELAATLRLAAIFADDGEIRPEHLPEAFHTGPAFQIPAEALPLGGSLDNVEAAAIQCALRNHGGNLSATARALGISRGTLYRKLKVISRIPSD